jgi:membrane AbrB-like protein
MSGRLTVNGWGPPLGGLVLALVAGLGCSWLRTPLPWMIGPLFAVAFARLAGLNVTTIPGARYAGQWIIGTALGLYFTPTVMKQLLSFSPWMVLAGIYALVGGVICGMALARLANVDRRTAFFASVPGGATEMSVLAERFGARTDLVAVAQSIRILIVVSVIPFLFSWTGVHGTDRYIPRPGDFSWLGLLELLALTALGGAALHRFRFPNGWVIGALFVALPLTAMEIEFSSLPTWLSNAGQLLIGGALATRFQKDFLSRAPRYLAAVSVSVLLAIAMAALFGGFLAWAMPANAATTILATAPGGIAEMAITAKVLQLGMPIVTAFHVARMVFLVSSTGLIYQFAQSWRAKRQLTLEAARRSSADRDGPGPKS